MEIDYLTRDGKGKEFVKKVKIKEFPTVDHAFVCQSVNFDDVHALIGTP